MNYRARVWSICVFKGIRAFVSSFIIMNNTCHSLVEMHKYNTQPCPKVCV